MLNFIVKLLEKLLVYLKNMQNKNIESLSQKTENIKVSKKWNIFLLSLWLLISIFTSVATITFINHQDSLPEFIKFILYILIIIFFVLIFIKFLNNLTKKYLFLVHLPLIISILMWFIIYDNNSSYLDWNIFTLLIWLFPVIFILKNSFVELNRSKILNTLEKVTFNYNLGYFFLLSLNTTLLIFWVEVMLFQDISEIIAEVVSVSGSHHWWGHFLEYIFFLLLTVVWSFIVLLYPVYTLHVYFDQEWKKKNNLNIWILLVVLLFILVSIWNWRGTIYGDIIKSAKTTFSEEGFNKESYNDVNKFLLKQAFIYKIEQKRSIDQELFKKVFDTTPMWLFWEKISKYSNSRNSFATNISKVWEKADVVFELAEIENNFIKYDENSSQYFLETNYNFYFENQTTTNQEVIINFETPSKYTVITDLLLGLNSELVWQISPRWAARKVYEDSLRRNTDPALIEKVGLNTYNLRIFPIPSKTVKQGKQKVVVKMVSPVLNENIIYTPKLSIINLKFNNESRVISKVYKDKELTKENILKTTSDIKDFISEDQIITLSDIWLWDNYSFWKMCIDPYLWDTLKYKNIDIDNNKKLWNKIHVFFDNSLSIKRNKSNKYYKEIFSAIKNYQWKLQDVDTYSYNFNVDKVSDVSDIEFWGYSNIDWFIDYLVANNIESKKIIFVTDDESFEYNSNQWTDFYSNNIASNQISVIKIWRKIKSYKSEFHTLLSMSEWNIYEINKSWDISNVIDKILEKRNENILKVCNNFNYSTNNKDNQLSIQAGLVSSMILSKIKQNSTSIPDLQNKIAKKYHIVNQFNSLIALETQRQQNDLDRYSNWSNKYNVSYDTWDNAKGFQVRRGGISFDSSNMVNSNLRGSSNFRINTSNSIWFWSSSDSMLNGMVMWDSSYSSRNYDKNIEINLIWFILMLIYITQIMSFVSFITKYIHRK